MEDIKIYRFSENSDTLGLLFVEGKSFCYTLENEFRVVKVKKETRIPAGRYLLKIRKEETPLTLKYRNRFTWFEYHIQITDVEGFQCVYLHVGNIADNTAGCILLGDSINNNKLEAGFLGNSAQAYKRFYEKIYPLLETEEIYINIIDEHNF